MGEIIICSSYLLRVIVFHRTKTTVWFRSFNNVYSTFENRLPIKLSYLRILGGDSDSSRRNTSQAKSFYSTNTNNSLTFVSHNYKFISSVLLLSADCLLLAVISFVLMQHHCIQNRLSEKEENLANARFFGCPCTKLFIWKKRRCFHYIDLGFFVDPKDSFEIFGQHHSDKLCFFDSNWSILVYINAILRMIFESLCIVKQWNASIN